MMTIRLAELATPVNMDLATGSVSAPRIPHLIDLDRDCAIGKLKAGVLQNKVAGLLGVSQYIRQTAVALVSAT